MTPECYYCRGSGLAQYVQDLKTGEMFGPYLAPFQAHDEVARLCELHSVTLSANWGIGIRFNEVGARCICREQIDPNEFRITEGQRTMIAALLTVFPPPILLQMQDKTWDTMPIDPGKNLAMRACLWLTKHRRTPAGRFGLVLYGSAGTGKTGLAYLLYKERQDLGAVWVRYSDMMRHIQDSYGHQADDTERIIKMISRTPLLFVDEMGNSKNVEETADKRRILHDVLDERNQQRLFTIVTSNLTPTAFKAQFGEPIYERLYESCSWIEVAGTNLRHLERTTSDLEPVQAGEGR